MSTTHKPRIAILISGRGSNMEALIQAIAQGSIDANIVLVAANRPDAKGLLTAKQAHIPTAVVDHTQFEQRAQFDAALAECVATVQPDLVILAGFMRILSAAFVDQFEGRLMNIHPSLLPKYPGLHTHQRALDQGDTFGGATVHYVTNELDGGPPIIQGQVAILPGDTAAALQSRVLQIEHQIYPLAAQWHLQGRLTLTGTKVLLDGVALPESGYAWNPSQC
jgi:phosphoribosylglycinamide formyltransferase-1